MKRVLSIRFVIIMEMIQFLNVRIFRLLSFVLVCLFYVLTEIEICITGNFNCYSEFLTKSVSLYILKVVELDLNGWFDSEEIGNMQNKDKILNNNKKSVNITATVWTFVVE